MSLGVGEFKGPDAWSACCAGYNQISLTTMCAAAVSTVVQTTLYPGLPDASWRHDGWMGSSVLTCCIGDIFQFSDVSTSLQIETYLCTYTHIYVYIHTSHMRPYCARVAA